MKQARWDQGQPFWDRVHPDDPSHIQDTVVAPKLVPEDNVDFGYRVIRQDGTQRWLTNRAEAVLDPETKSIHIVGALVDVTGLKQQKEELREALRGRDLLIDEVNHRIKNSLQLVASILNMETRGASDEGTKIALRSASARVEAVAPIHVSLHQDGEVSRVGFKPYLERFCTQLRQPFTADALGVAIVVDADPLTFPTDKAITPAVVVNELVRLIVADDGTGPATEQLATKGIGWRLIAGMATQLGGDVERTSGPDG